MRDNAQNAQQGEQEVRGAGEGRKKTVRNRDMRSVVGSGMGWGTIRVNKMDTTGTFRSLHDRGFQEGKQGI